MKGVPGFLTDYIHSIQYGVFIGYDCIWKVVQQQPLVVNVTM